MLRQMTLAIALFAIAACGNKAGGGGADCKPLTATIDGQAVTGLSHGLGYVEKGDYSLYLFNHDKVTCEQMLAKSRTTSADEVFISAGKSSYGPAVAYNANAKLGSGVEVALATKPSKPGDRMGMCIKASVPLKNGEHAGKTLTVEGLLAGTFCGERK